MGTNLLRRCAHNDCISAMKILLDRGDLHGGRDEKLDWELDLSSAPQDLVSSIVRK
jgi:hypothetical protein